MVRRHSVRGGRERWRGDGASTAGGRTTRGRVVAGVRRQRNGRAWQAADAGGARHTRVVNGARARHWRGGMRQSAACARFGRCCVRARSGMERYVRQPWWRAYTRAVTAWARRCSVERGVRAAAIVGAVIGSARCRRRLCRYRCARLCRCCQRYARHHRRHARRTDMAWSCRCARRVRCRRSRVGLHTVWRIRHWHWLRRGAQQLRRMPRPYAQPARRRRSVCEAGPRRSCGGYV